MIRIRPALARGHFDFGWLDTWHSFSFGEYRDPAHDRFRDLRVINEDRIAPGAGFGLHPHREMEILTWVLEGALAHRDSLGSEGVVRPGDAQRMTAGTGIRHSEFNASATDPVHLLQIWLLPRDPGASPGYAQVHFPAEERRNRFRIVASPDGRQGSLRWVQDATLHATLLDAGREGLLPLPPGHGAWIQVASGAVELGGVSLGPGDGAAVEDLPELRIRAQEDAEVLVFILP